jgi:hypothetical protein
LATKQSQRKRWKRIEHRVAEVLSKWFRNYGLSPITRIPVNGREGPDLSTNEIMLFIDVKSRLQVPISAFPKSIGYLGTTMVSVRLSSLDKLTGEITEVLPPSLLVRGWLDHMSQYITDNIPWVMKNKKPSGIPAIVLHKPGLAAKDATLIIYKRDLKRINERIVAHQRKLEEIQSTTQDPE